MAGLALAVQIAILDRWPQFVANERVWRLGRFDAAFEHRWLERPIPGETQRWLDRLSSIEHGPVATTYRRRQNERYRKQRLAGPADLTLVNVGPGKRRKNSLYVALAVDATLSGAPASAMSWEYPDEPSSPFGTGELAQTAVDARRIVEAWGRGSKGVVSLRDPAHPARRWFTATNTDGQARFADYSEPDVTRTPAELAASHLASIDEHFGFPSIIIWRRADPPNQSPIPDDFFTRDRADGEALLAKLLGPGVDATVRNAAFDHVWYQQNLSHARWLVRALQRGACTILPDYLTDLANGVRHIDDAKPMPLTRIDGALLELLGAGQSTMHRGVIEVTVADTPRNRQLGLCFAEVETRSRRVDGLTSGTIELCIDHRSRERLGEDHPTYQAPLDGQPDPGQPPVPRQVSWIDTNRAPAPPESTRKTNCWNTAAAIANYLATAAPSTSLPIYRSAPLRPTIPEYLEMVGAVGQPRYVQTLAEADEIVRSWGPLAQGIVAAAHSKMSTHMFNVFCDADGETVRYLDGHTGEDGDFNFDVSWMRIGIVQLEARCHNFG